MKHLLAFLLILAITPLSAQTQDAQSREERVRSMRIAFLTRELKLSPEEAQAFWPLFNEYEESISKMHRERRNLHKSMASKRNPLNAEQAELGMMRGIELEKEMALTREKYYLKFKRILGPQKAGRLYASEMEFHRKVMEQLHKRRKPEAEIR